MSYNRKVEVGSESRLPTKQSSGPDGSGAHDDILKLSGREVKGFTLCLSSSFNLPFKVTST